MRGSIERFVSVYTSPTKSTGAGAENIETENIHAFHSFTDESLSRDGPCRRFPTSSSDIAFSFLYHLFLFLSHLYFCGTFISNFYFSI